MNALVYVDIDQGIHKGKMKVARNEKRKKLLGFSFYINIGNFEEFLRNLNLSAKHLFWRCGLTVNKIAYSHFSPFRFPFPFPPWNWLKSPCHFLPKFHNMVLIPSMHNLIHFLLQTINLQAWSPFEAPPSSHPFQGTPFEWKSSHKKSLLTNVADKHFTLYNYAGINCESQFLWKNCDSQLRSA